MRPLATLLLFVLAAGLYAACPGCGKSDEGYIDQLRKAHASAKDMAQLLPARQCVAAYQARFGRFPKDLDELKKEFAEFPAPPNGMKYRYDASSGELDLVPAQ